MNIYQIIELDVKDCLPSRILNWVDSFLFLILFKIYYVAIYWNTWNKILKCWFKLVPHYTYEKTL